VRVWHAAQEKTNGRARTPHLVPDVLSEELQKLASALDRIAENQRDDEQKIEIEAASGRCLAMAEAIKQWLGQELGDQVYWVEVSGERSQRLALASAPIEVGPVLKKQLFEQVPTAILTSATLSVGDGAQGFDHLRQRLGLEDCTTLQLGSPFEYQKQV